MKQTLAHCRARPHMGMTLIELLIVIAISAILLAVGVPMFNATISGSKTAGAASDIRGALELARSEAIRRGVNVSVCRATAPSAASPVCDAGAAGIFLAGDWASGWIVYAERDSLTGAPCICVIRVENSASSGSRALITGNVASVSFGPDGVRQAAAGTTASFTVASNDPNSPRTRRICVGVMGQIFGQPGACPP